MEGLCEPDTMARLGIAIICMGSVVQIALGRPLTFDNPVPERHVEHACRLNLSYRIAIRQS